MVYEPFGKVRYSWQSGSYSNDYKYTGKEQDSETNWQYYGARYYDNNRGQFMSADPVFLGLGLGDLSGLADPQMWNSYAYARNNPYKYYDPNGENFKSFLKKLDNAMEKFMDVATAWIPGVSDARDIVEAATGRNIVTGEALTQDQKEFTAFVTTLPLISGSGARMTDDILDGLDSLKAISRRTRWADPTKLEDHFIRHGGDFGSSTMEIYAKNANDFYSRGMNEFGSGIQRKIDSDGTIRMWEKNTNTFAAYGSDGSTKTFFKPGRGEAYWNDQPGVLIE